MIHVNSILRLLVCSLRRAPCSLHSAIILHMPFTFKTLSIPGVILIEPRAFGDDRGFFMETYRYSDFASAGIKESFVQDNYSRSLTGILRGLHYQKDPNAQGKLVQCITGKDFRCGRGYQKRFSQLREMGCRGIVRRQQTDALCPAGFAHGFLVLSETADVMYKCTKEYSPADDRGIIWNDPDIGIEWPLKGPLLSGKDREHPLLKDADNNFEYPHL